MATKTTSKQKRAVPSPASHGSAASLPERKTWELLAEGEEGQGLMRDPLRLGGDVLMWFCGYSRSLKLFVRVPRAMAEALDSGKWSRLPYLDFLDEVIYPALHSCARRRGRAGWPSGDSYWGRVREPQNDALCRPATGSASEETLPAQTVCEWCKGSGELRQAYGYPKECGWCHGTGKTPNDQDQR